MMNPISATGQEVERGRKSCRNIHELADVVYERWHKMVRIIRDCWGIPSKHLHRKD